MPSHTSQRSALQNKELPSGHDRRVCGHQASATNGVQQSQVLATRAWRDPQTTLPTACIAKAYTNQMWRGRNGKASPVAQRIANEAYICRASQASIAGVRDQMTSSNDIHHQPKPGRIIRGRSAAKRHRRGLGQRQRHRPRPARNNRGVCASAGRHQHWPTASGNNQGIDTSDMA
ncbi:hypothetical protein H5410_014744 [Solanum commersonii]|uniref:Uncharacterized protein n=1 Tax=Solanum commersonii TaxID=4109 RepID=A0A9J5ZRW5_SOLCO|nr:hypothetical protein H5410_014744 [Solanum commersonii]